MSMRNLAVTNTSFFGGFSYRHLMVWHNKENNFSLTPPHDISDRVIGEYLPKDETILNLMKKKVMIFLKDHPINKEKKQEDCTLQTPFGYGETEPSQTLTHTRKRFGIKGAVVSAVDLIKGIGYCAGLDVLEVEGATGNVNTNFDGKAEAAINALKGDNDFVYIHLEAPDEAGHRHEIENKVKAIELIDQKDSRAYFGLFG